jgi:hypothetical protein
MADSQPPVIDNEHYMLFGRITSNFARAEMAFKMAAAEMLKIPIHFMLIIAAPYTTVQVRNVTKSLAKIMLDHAPDCRDKLVELLGIHKAATTLRNDIGHNMWTKGVTIDRIRPMYADIRSEKAEFFGITKDSRSYSKEDLTQSANKMVKLNQDLISFLDSDAFLEAIAAYTELSSIEVERILGISRTESSS